MKTLSSLLLSLLIGVSSYAAQIGDTVQELVPLSERVTLPGNGNQAAAVRTVAEITLDDGVWSISGQVNIWSPQTQFGTQLFIGANISIDTPSFEPRATAAVLAAKSGGGNIIQNVAMVPRVIEVDNGTHIFMVAGNFNPAVTMFAWGFITAVKIRNHIQ